MKIDVETWDREWHNAHERSPLRVTPENEERWNRYWNLCAEQYGLEVEAETCLYEKIINHLESGGYLLPGDIVLDVGCGPGTYTIPLAAKARQVVGLDNSTGMIQELESRAKRKGLSNVRTILRDWNDPTPLPQQYDLVISGQSPAIKDAAALFKMGACSTRHCCYTTASWSDEMQIRNELWKRLIGPFTPSSAYDIKYPLNILLESGVRPDLKFITGKTEVALDPQTVVRNYISYFEIFTVMDEERSSIVKDYIMERSQEGVLWKKASKILAVMTWSPHQILP
ncbi:MAG: class I SAM-dependent methyltransferase [Methanomassiliicoccales archaeon]|nr:MAG: class I SAM-dependent methyltransferase [Methanomassiliicoccales archaeon]